MLACQTASMTPSESVTRLYSSCCVGHLLSTTIASTQVTTGIAERMIWLSVRLEVGGHGKGHCDGQPGTALGRLNHRPDV